MQKNLLQSAREIGRRYLCGSLLSSAVEPSVLTADLPALPYSSFVLQAVQFDPDKIALSELEDFDLPSSLSGGEHLFQCGSSRISFPWISAKPCLNGFHSVHGGTLCTLAETFSKIHLQAAVVASMRSQTAQQLASPSEVQSTLFSLSSSSCCFPSPIHFDIRFLSATGENQKCRCSSYIRPGKEIFSVDFTFTTEFNNEVMAVGTQMLSWKQ